MCLYLGPHHLHRPPDLWAGEDVREQEVPLILRTGRHGKAAERHWAAGEKKFFLLICQNKSRM